ncbi:hypothetical protein FAI40_03050 [Acetobacteraceae bacterium]|nr:hypothetical protein FAI40_03050 [Acetobacteraceae bacterium]
MRPSIQDIEEVISMISDLEKKLKCLGANNRNTAGTYIQNIFGELESALSFEKGKIEEAIEKGTWMM